MGTTFYIGISAAILTNIAFLPQVIKAAKSRHTGDLSLAMYSIFSVGVATWIIYGVIIGSWPVILANGATLISSLYILFLKLKYG